MLVETDEEEAVLVAERIRQSVADHPFQFESTPLNLTISIGVASMAGDMTMTPSSLLQVRRREPLPGQTRRDGIACVSCSKAGLTGPAKRAAPRSPPSGRPAGGRANTTGSSRTDTPNL